MAHQKIIIPIRGMHCRSCEMVLEEKIGSVRGVQKVRSNFKKSIAEIEYSGSVPDMREIDRAVISAGYSRGPEDTKHFFSHRAIDYMELAAAGSILLAVYAVLRGLGVLDYTMQSTSTPGLIGVFVVGLTAGVSTCMALVGGLVLGMSARHAELHPEATRLQKFRPHLFFNIGRIMSFVILGGLIGLVGKAFTLSSPVLGSIILMLGIVMLVLGLKLTSIFPRLEKVSFGLPKSIARALGLNKETKEYSHRGAFLTGVATFFVPCGFTQAIQLYAISTGSYLQGALIMGVFALGTLPGILGIGGLTSVIKGVFARYFFKFAGLVVIALAIFNIQNGYNLTGMSFASVVKFNPENTETTAQQAVVENGKQIIEMTQDVGGYSPRQFTVKKGVPVVWKIKSLSKYTCAAYISLPAYGIRRPLMLGDNIIEFTPTDVGTLKFTCSMGMYSGVITVVE